MFNQLNAQKVVIYGQDTICSNNEYATVFLDFQNKGAKTLSFLNRLDKIVMEYGGALYPAKDSRMSKDIFEKSLPNLNEFSNFIDPKFSSSFWRRVNN